MPQGTSKPGLFVGRDIILAQSHNTQPSGALFCVEACARAALSGIYHFVFSVAGLYV